jgi:site-specific DNA-adenine methylase
MPAINWMTSKPLVRRLGSKWRQRWLFDLFPKHRKLLDAFCGGCTASIWDFPTPGWAVDQDCDLLNFFDVLTRCGAEFFHRLLTEFPGGCRFIYERVKRIYDSKLWLAHPEEWRAVAYYWLLQMRFPGRMCGAECRGLGSYGGVLQVPKSHEVLDYKLKTRGTHSKEDFVWFCSRLRNTELVYGDGIEWIKKLDYKGMLYFVDPPYDSLDSKAGADKYSNMAESPLELHERLIPALAGLQRAKVMLTTGATPAVRKMLDEYLFGEDEWIWLSTGKKHKSTSRSGEESAVSNEIVVLNYEPSAQTDITDWVAVK